MNSPQGVPPPPPHLRVRMLGDCHAFKACICRTAVQKAHGAMKSLHFGYTLARLWLSRHCVCEAATSKTRSQKRSKISTNRSQNPPKSRPGFQNRAKKPPSDTEQSFPEPSGLEVTPSELSRAKWPRSDPKPSLLEPGGLEVTPNRVFSSQVTSKLPRAEVSRAEVSRANCRQRSLRCVFRV